jgi:hypothetical protein
VADFVVRSRQNMIYHEGQVFQEMIIMAAEKKDGSNEERVIENRRLGCNDRRNL